MADKPVGDIHEVITQLSSAWKDMHKDSEERVRIEQSKFQNDEELRNKTYLRYARKDTWFVKGEGIPLILGFTPSTSSIVPDKYNKWLINEIESSMNVGLEVLNGEGKLEKWRVQPKEFVAWARRKGVKVPALLVQILDHQKQAPLAKPQLRQAEYSTPLLDICKYVISEFWEKDGIKKAPSRDWIVDHLMDKFQLSKNEAQAVDTVTRHPERKKGGHIKR